MDKYILIINENVTIDVIDTQDAVDVLLTEYLSFDISMHEILAGVSIYGFTAEEVVNIYAECMKISDGDTIVHLRDDLEALNFFEDKEILGLK